MFSTSSLDQELPCSSEKPSERRMVLFTSALRLFSWLSLRFSLVKESIVPKTTVTIKTKINV